VSCEPITFAIQELFRHAATVAWIIPSELQCFKRRYAMQWMTSGNCVVAEPSCTARESALLQALSCENEPKGLLTAGYHYKVHVPIGARVSGRLHRGSSAYHASQEIRPAWAAVECACMTVYGAAAQTKHLALLDKKKGKAGLHQSI
jgi:hypothetical protein